MLIYYRPNITRVQGLKVTYQFQVIIPEGFNQNSKQENNENSSNSKTKPSVSNSCKKIDIIVDKHEGKAAFRLVQRAFSF